MTKQYMGITLYTLAQAHDSEPKLHARIVNIEGSWLILFGKKIAFTDDADLVGILHESSDETPIAFNSKTAAADYLDQHSSSFASVSC
jgi:hypothetical protein